MFTSIKNFFLFFIGKSKNVLIFDKILELEQKTESTNENIKNAFVTIMLEIRQKNNENEFKNVGFSLKNAKNGTTDAVMNETELKTVTEIKTDF